MEAVLSGNRKMKEALLMNNHGIARAFEELERVGKVEVMRELSFSKRKVSL